MENVKEKLKYTVISISIAWQQMYQANQVLTTFADIIMTTPQYVLFTHVSIEDIFNTSIDSYYTIMHHFEIVYLAGLIYSYVYNPTLLF